MITPEPEILVNQYIELRDDRLEESRNRDSVIHPSRNIGDPEFKRRENVMGPDVPPDLRTVLDAVHFDEQIDVALILLSGFEMVRNIGTRKLLKDFGTIGFESCIESQPERRRRR